MVKKAQRNPNSRFYGLLAVIALVGVAALTFVASRSSSEAITVDPNLPPGEAEGYLLGNPNAPVQVMEFADFECPACAQFFAITEPDIRKRLVEPGIISFRFFDFPLPGHKHTWQASMAAACAADQGKFWEMHDQIFQAQDRWNGQATNRPKGVLQDLAAAAGVNVAQWEECYDSRKHLARIEANRREAERRGIPSTPSFIIGNKMISGAVGYDKFKAYVDSALALVDTTVARTGSGDTALSKAVARDTGSGAARQ